jgi:hypothetical protein
MVPRTAPWPYGSATERSTPRVTHSFHGGPHRRNNCATGRPKPSGTELLNRDAASPRRLVSSDRRCQSQPQRPQPGRRRQDLVDLEPTSDELALGRGDSAMRHQGDGPARLMPRTRGSTVEPSVSTRLVTHAGVAGQGQTQRSRGLDANPVSIGGGNRAAADDIIAGLSWRRTRRCPHSGGPDAVRARAGRVRGGQLCERPPARRATAGPQGGARHAGHHQAPR